MNLLLVVDEVALGERIQEWIKQFDSSINIVGNLNCINEAVHWLQNSAHPDLLLLDTHLREGLSFEIFREAPIRIPVVFISSFEKFSFEAFNYPVIDYILKPVTAERLASAIHKYRHLQKSSADYHTAVHQRCRYKDRFMAKVGNRTFLLQSQEVAYFLADNKTVYLVDKEGNRFIINYSIEKLEPLLDPYNFFRVNRKVIIHSQVIEVIKPYHNNRLKLVLKNLAFTEDMVVSRERCPEFKKWAEG